MYEAIRRAKRSIYLETYVFRNTVPGLDFIEVIADRARAGVKVVIVLDGFSVFFSGGEIKKILTPLGGEVMFFKRWFHRIHRKLLIVDEKIAFIGGVNFGRRMAGWWDLHAKIEGRFAKSLFRSFAYSYKVCGGKDPHLLALAKQTSYQKARIKMRRAKHRLLEHWPFKGKRALKDYYIQSIRGAKERVMIATQYFLPHKWLVRELLMAKKRGIKIEIILPEESDWLIMTLANIGFVRELHPKGIDFHFTKTFLHAKVLLIDNHEGMVGTNNIDALSFDFNVEASVIFNRKDMVGDLRKILDEWKASAVSFDETIHAARWYIKPFEWFARLFVSVL